MKTDDKGRHLGRNISKIRELLGLKQEALAFAVGLSQQAVSSIENSAHVDNAKIALFAKALQISPQVIANFDEKGMLDYLETLDENGLGGRAKIFDYNLFQKLLEAFELNNRLHVEKQSLYERLLQNEQEKCRYMEKMLAAAQSGMNL